MAKKPNVMNLKMRIAAGLYGVNEKYGVHRVTPDRVGAVLSWVEAQENQHDAILAYEAVCRSNQEAAAGTQWQVECNKLMEVIGIATIGETKESPSMSPAQLQQKVMDDQKAELEERAAETRAERAAEAAEDGDDPAGESQEMETLVLPEPPMGVQAPAPVSAE